MPAMLPFNDNAIDMPYIVCPFMAMKNCNNFKTFGCLDLPLR